MTPDPVTTELQARIEAAVRLSDRGRLAEAVDDYAAAVELLPVAHQDRDRVPHGLGSMAAAAAIAAGQPERAVQLLEQERAVRWGRLLGPPPDPRPVPFSELSLCADAGHVVIVNVSRFRCDALIVGRSGVRVVPLPGLTSEDATDRAARCLRAVAERSRTLPQAVFACLEWMWEAFARDVLDALDTASSAGRPPRVWWSPTGPLSGLPLHAAGFHDPDDGRPDDSVLYRVVSSYTPSLHALLRARRRVPGGMEPLLVAAVPESPAHLPQAGGLGIAWEEAVVLPQQFGGPATVLLGAEATRSAVLDALPTHPYVHFSCHGGPDGDDPAGAVLHLHDAALRLSDLVPLDLSRAHLAVLSACETSYLGTGTRDETLLLGAAFHMIGYRHVVAALWPVRDESSLILGACVAENPWGPAAAVHDAARWLREQHPHDPTAWVPYVHIGA